MRRRITVLAAAILLALSVSVVAASPAQAHKQWQCPHGQSCLFLNFDGGGWIMPIVWSTTPKYTCVSLVSFYRNEASSVVADFGSGWDLVLYENVDCSDVFRAVFRSPTHKNFAWCNTCNPLNYLNDDVEAFRIECLNC